MLPNGLRRATLLGGFFVFTFAVGSAGGWWLRGAAQNSDKAPATESRVATPEKAAGSALLYLTKATIASESRRPIEIVVPEIPELADKAFKVEEQAFEFGGKLGTVVLPSISWVKTVRTEIGPARTPNITERVTSQDR